MIELRWLNTSTKEYRDENTLPKIVDERVLQFRVEIKPSGVAQWGEWQDIPEVHVEG